MSTGHRNRLLISVFLTAAVIMAVGCAVLKRTMSKRWIPDCGGISHNECCKEVFGEDYVCTGVRFNKNGEPEIECSLRE